MKRAATALVAMTVLQGAPTGDAAAADVAFGEYLSGECVTCHRKDGQDNGIPSIVGWPPEQFTAVLLSYKSKDRANLVMQTIAARLTEDEMQALAAYFESLKAK